MRSVTSGGEISGSSNGGRASSSGRAARTGSSSRLAGPVTSVSVTGSGLGQANGQYVGETETRMR